MNRWRSLGAKLFASHLVVTLLAVITAVVVGQLLAAKHLAEGASVLSGSAMGPHFLRILNISFLWAAGGAVVLAGLAGSLFAWYLSRPTAQLREAASAIAAGNYAKRVRVRSRDELNELAVAFNHMAQSLESQEKLRRELIANVAHELRTPLTSIQGYMEALLDGVFPPDPATFELVHEEVGRLKRLADELAQLASLESGETSWKPEPLDVAAIAEAATERFRALFHQKNVELVVQAQPQLPPMWGDGDQLARLLNNLLANALQFTPPGGRVCLVLRVEHESVRLVVRDTGTGVAEEDLPHLFERFYRADRSRARSTGGIGLGLSIAENIVRRHGGTIRVESELGKGSAFVVELPIGGGSSSEGSGPRRVRSGGKEKA